MNFVRLNYAVDAYRRQSKLRKLRYRAVNQLINIKNG